MRVSARFFLRLAAVEIVLVAVGLAAFGYTRPLPTFTTATALPASVQAATAPGVFPWPARGQAVLAISGLGTVGSSGADAGAQPIASTAKLMTALLIVERHPLVVGTPGPSVAISASDVDAYRTALSQDESSLPVQEGVPLTELQLLQGLLLPSANNYADILARWDSGSVSTFVAAMNARAQALAMNQTHFEDPSGFSAKTVSTAPDLLALAQAVIANPVLAGIVKQAQVTLPVAGLVRTTNLLLGEQGVIGLKTGNTDEAGGCFAFAATAGPQDHPVTVLGVVLGQTDLAAAFRASSALLNAVPSWLTTTPIVAKGDVVGAYAAASGESSRLIARGDLTLDGWAGDRIQLDLQLDRRKAPLEAGTKVGELTASTRDQRVTIDILAMDAIPAPGPWWRLWRN